MTTSYTDVFDSSAVPSANSSFTSVLLTADASFAWPYGYTGTLEVLAKIVEISSTQAVTITFPAANEVSVGEDVIVRNTGGYTLTIHDITGGTIATIAAGEATFLYLKNVSTAAGSWGTLAYGVGTSSVDAASLVGSGIVAVASKLNQALVVSATAVGINIDATYLAKLINFTGGADTLTFSASSDLGDGFFVMIRNSGTGTLNLDPDGSELIDGTSTTLLQPGESTIIGCSGSALFTVGMGRSTTYQFTQLTKDLTTCSLPNCTGAVTTLTSIEASNKLMTFLGSPSADQTVIVPDVVAVYYVYNGLSTAYNVTIKTSSGYGSAVTQNGRAILFCDGVNVFAAQTVAVTSALAMQDGLVTAPGLAFAAETNTGIYRPTTSQVGIAVNGAMSAIFGSSGLITAAHTNLTSTNLNAALAELQDDIDTRATTSGIASGTMTFTGKTFNLTDNTLVATSLQLATAVTDETGSGKLVFATSPTLVTPLLGTPTSGNLTNCTFPTLNQDTTGTAAMANALKSATTTINVSSATAPTNGQVLTATSGTAATWQTLPAGNPGTVTTTSVVSINGFAGTVANATSTPAITLTTSITGLLKGSAGALTAASAGTDFVAPGGALGTPSSGNLTSIPTANFPTLNQSTTGNAATATTATVANGLKTASTTVVVSGATAPTNGQVLTASSSTAASWTTPAVASSTVGRHSIWVPAVAMTPRKTTGCYRSSYEVNAGISYLNFSTVDFLDAADSYACFAIRMPRSWDRSTVTAQYVFSVPDSTAGTVWFTLQGMAVGSGESLTALNYGSGTPVSTTVGTLNTLYQSAESSAITVSGTVAIEDWVAFQVSRNSSDSYIGIARLHGINIIYTTSADTDA